MSTEQRRRTWCVCLSLLLLLSGPRSSCRGFVMSPTAPALSASSRSFPLPYRRVVVVVSADDASSLTFLKAQEVSIDADMDELFDEYFAESIAKDVYRSLDVPFFLPKPVVTFLIEQTVQNLSTDLSQGTKLSLQEMLEAQATPSKDDNFREDEIHALADRIAEEINPKIDVPVLDEDQELILLQQILRVVLESIGSTSRSRRKKLIDTNLQVSKDLLGGPESRLQLAQSIDQQMVAIVPLPLEQAQRIALISKAVDSSADLLTRLLPPELMETLKGESPETLVKMKDYLIDTVNDKVDIMGLDETQERKLVQIMVNLLIDEYVDGTNAEFLLLSQQEQVERLEQRKFALERQKMNAQRRHEREQASLDRKLARIEERLRQETSSSSRATATTTTTTTTRSGGRRSFWRRVFRRRKKKD